MAITIPILTEFSSKGIDKAITEFNSLKTSGEKAQFAIKKAAVPAAAALAGLAAAGIDFAKAAAEDAAGAATLAQQLRNTTLASDKQIKGNEKWISSVSMSAAVADDELRPALQKLATGTGSLELSQKLLKTALDVSAATGKPLIDVADALSKGYAGNMKGLKALSPELAAMIKDHASFSDVTARLDENYKGMALTLANSAEGGFKKMGIALQETKESIGAALLPVVQELATKFAVVGQWAQDHSSLFVTLGVVIGGIAASVIAVNTALKVYEAYTKLAAAATWLWNAALDANPVVLVGVAIAALVAAIVIAYHKFDWFRNLVDGLWDGFTAGFDAIAKPVAAYAQFLAGVYKGVFNGIADGWNNTIGKISFKLPSWLGGFGFDVPNIPKLAAGGIVTSPTLALIGEAGPEAVVPLNRGNSMGNNVTINVNGGDPNAVVSALRSYMRTNGSVPIKVSNAY
jgi:hypothetical protein